MDRRDFLRSGGLVAAALAAHRAPALEAFGPPLALEEATVAELHGRLESGELSSRRLTAAYLARIDALDRHGPELRHLIETNPDALEIASALDAERKARGPRGPLHGMPVLLKDNVDTADKTTTTAGSLALAASIPPRDAFVAERLRAAGGARHMPAALARGRP